MCAPRDGADVGRTFGGRRELEDAVRGERWTYKGSSLFPSGVFDGNEWEKVVIGNRALKVGYQLNVEL